MVMLIAGSTHGFTKMTAFYNLLTSQLLLSGAPIWGPAAPTRYLLGSESSLWPSLPRSPTPSKSLPLAQQAPPPESRQEGLA
jgi:hypothetical protein